MERGRVYNITKSKRYDVVLIDDILKDRCTEMTESGLDLAGRNVNCDDLERTIIHGPRCDHGTGCVL